MLIYHFELGLEEGIELLSKEKPDRLYRGKLVSACSGWDLFKSLEPDSIRCWECGVKADRWIADKGKTDLQGPPVLNLYATKDGEIVLMNRDHIIPRSLGGTDAVANLRPACHTCNGCRGNSMEEADYNFLFRNLNLFNATRFLAAEKKAAKAIAEGLAGPDLMKPFSAMRSALHSRDTGISLQIGAAVPGQKVPKPPQRKKTFGAGPSVKKTFGAGSSVKPDVIKSYEVLITDNLEQARLAMRGVVLRWKNDENGRFIGPYIDLKDRYE